MRRGAKIDLGVTIRDGQRFHIKMWARILNLVPDSEPGEAGGRLVCRLVVIWQVVIKSGLTFGSLYLEQLALPLLPWQMPQLVIVMTANCWHGFVSPAHLHLVCFFFGGGGNYYLILIPSFQWRRANHRGSSVPDRCSHTVSATPAFLFFPTAVFVQVPLCVNADCNKVKRLLQ